jgi:hypothetical protein
VRRNAGLAGARRHSGPDASHHPPLPRRHDPQEPAARSAGGEANYFQESTTGTLRHGML